MIRKTLAALAALTIVLVTSGCMKLNLDLSVNKDDTVSGSLILAYSNEALALANSMGSSSSLNTDSLITQQPGMTVTAYKDDKYTGSKITFDAKPFSEFSTGTSAGALKFTRAGNIISVTGAIDMSGGDPSTIEQVKNNPLTSGLFQKSDISVSITMPGKITSKTGVIEGNKVTFKGQLGDNIVIDAQSDDSAGFDVATIAIAGGALALLAAGGAFLVIRRKKSPKLEAAAASPDQFDNW
jgi:hypothetical protein